MRKTKMKMNKAISLVALATFTACDYVEKKDLREERSDRAYRTAMDDYRSGRIDAAVAGFKKVVRKDPANASARFQLACLQQDAKKDFLEAFCGYREYLMQHPESEKAKLASDRLAICEKELAMALATKYGFNREHAFADELDTVRRKLAETEKRMALSEKNLGDSQLRVRSLLSERDRLLKIVKGEDVKEGESIRPAVAEVKELLEENEESAAPAPTEEALQLKSETDEESASSAATPEEVAKLKSEESDEVTGASSLIVSAQLNGTTNKTFAVQGKPKAAKQRLMHPSEYVVKEGDTLYSISKRFYGAVSAWKRIRDANKAVIPMDNRLRTGDKLVLPEVAP